MAPLESIAHQLLFDTLPMGFHHRIVEVAPNNKT